tara:strand:+ start:2546 stop:3313 length:768 start_codon:yes stop_codon:yes gene_type:complete
MNRLLLEKKNNLFFCSLILVIISSIYVYGNDKINNFLDIAGVKFEILKNGESNRRYIWIHGDEKTAELLIRKYLKENDGTAYLINSTEREVLINGYILDPNRIFTNDGAKRNLIKLNNSISKLELNKTIELISNDRDDFFKSISPPKGGLLIALHNNIREYSIDNEIPLSTAVSLKNMDHPDHHNFFICTNQEDYNILKKSPFNVVLQDKQIENDDGSLSWYASRKNIRFINIETRLGYLSTQAKMLKYVNENLF